MDFVKRHTIMDWNYSYKRVVMCQKRIGMDQMLAASGLYRYIHVMTDLEVQKGTFLPNSHYLN